MHRILLTTIFTALMFVASCNVNENKTGDSSDRNGSLSQASNTLKINKIFPPAVFENDDYEVRSEFCGWVQARVPFSFKKITSVSFKHLVC